MKMKTIIFRWFIMILFVFGVLQPGLVVHAEGDAVVTVAPQDLILEIGQCTRVDVNIRNISNWFGVDIQMTYDPDVFSVTDATSFLPGINVNPGDALAYDYPLMNTVDITTGLIWIGFMQMNPTPPVDLGEFEEKTIFWFELCAVDHALSSDLTVTTLDLSTPDGFPIDRVWTDATISINIAPTGITDSYSTNEDTPLVVSAPGILGNDTDADSDPLTAINFTDPGHGTLTALADGSFTYTPDANYYGSDSFTYQVTDTAATSDPVDVNLTINPVNDAPSFVAGADQTVAEDSAAQMVTAWATEISTGSLNESGQTLTFHLTTDHDDLFSELPAVNPLTGTLTYTPAANANGSAAVSVWLTDSGGIALGGEDTSSIEAFTITVTPVNDAPTAYSFSVSTAEDTPVGVTLSGSDVENSPLTYHQTSDPAHGTLSGTLPDLTYTPDVNYFGSDSFKYVVNDGTVNSTEATVSITITAVNDVPQVSNQSEETDEDTVLNFSITVEDPDDSSFTYHAVSGPTHGILSGTFPNFSYTPALNFYGVDTISYYVEDGQDNSGSATVTITVNPVNDPPTGSSASYSLDEDTSKGFVLAGEDVDSPSLSFVIIRNPANGSLSGTVPNLTYSPDADYFGVDHLEYHVSDGTAVSETEYVYFSVTNVNDAPSFEAGADETINEDAGAQTVTGWATQISPGPANENTQTVQFHTSTMQSSLFAVQPAVDASTGTLTYTPAANANGIATVSVWLQDNGGSASGDDTSLTETLTITINEVNDAPTANDFSVAVVEDTPKDFALDGDDVDGDSLTFVIDTNPSEGVLNCTGEDCTYSPAENFNGSDSFTYHVEDPSLASSGTVTVTLNVSAVNDAPTAAGFSVTTDEDTTKDFTLNGVDVDEDLLTYHVDTNPSKGVLNCTADNCTFTPNANLNGSDSFTYHVEDPDEESSASVTVSITITAVNDAPTASNFSVEVVEDTPKAFTLNGNDVDGDVLSYVYDTTPTHGTLSGTAPNLTYNPETGYHGLDTLTYHVTDPQGASSVTVTVTFDVGGVNDAPTAIGFAVETDEDTAKTFTLNGEDEDEDPLTYHIVTTPTKGTLNCTDEDCTYTPHANQNGTDSFTYYVQDPYSEVSDTVTVTINISAVNDAPTAEGFTITTLEDTSKVFTLNGNDVDGELLSFEFDNVPSKGTLTGSAPNLTYVPDADENGSDSFTYHVEDPSGASSAEVTVNITITPVNDAPSFTVGADQTVNEDSGLVTRSGWVSDMVSGPSNESTQSLTFITTAATTSLFSQQPAVSSSGTLTFTPAANLSGSTMVTVQLCDNGGTNNEGENCSAEQSFTITINPVNDAPIANNGSFFTYEDTPVAVVTTGSDIDSSSLTFIKKSDPTNGTLIGTLPNVVYQPDPDFNGQDSFTFTVSDGLLESDTATITITVRTENDAPTAASLDLAGDEDTPFTVTLSGSDPDDDPLTFIEISEPSHGTLSGTAPNLTYSPDPDYFGSDTFTYRVSDGLDSSAPATVTLTIGPVNDAPIALGESYDAVQNVTLVVTPAQGVLVNDSDVDQDSLTTVLVSATIHGQLTLNPDGSFTYIPDINYTGPDQFTYAVSDGSLNSTSVSVTITVLPGIPITGGTTLYLPIITR